MKKWHSDSLKRILKIGNRRRRRKRTETEVKKKNDEGEEEERWGARR